MNGVKVNEKIEKGLEFHESEAVKTIEAVKFFSLGKTLVFILIVLAAVVFALGLVLWIYTLF
ncbi:MAG: hypothetical protein COV47_03965 [Candidatus Diapherotrites archaeon CG11_big_fil_rev_8_21_14_0_20_37_9]|nr:MAG: hypothetical protein COV47_03965 [Candidatus Diapherotrites archaeon CG11_big_fil_rev_8_21_14_0_20_37_9]